MKYKEASEQVEVSFNDFNAQSIRAQNVLKPLIIEVFEHTKP